MTIIILNISEQLEKCELVATQLGLTPAEIEAIEYNNRTIEMMRYNTLKKWKSKALLSGTAMYGVNSTTSFVGLWLQ